MDTIKTVIECSNIEQLTFFVGHILYILFSLFSTFFELEKNCRFQAAFDNLRQILLVESAVYTILFITQIRKYCHITITIDRLIASFVRAQNYLIFAVFEL